MFVVALALSAPAQALDDASAPRPPVSAAALAPERPVQLALGTNVSCARSNAGRVRCWGLESSGVFLDAPRGRRTPTEIPAIRAVSELFVGGAHACALDADGALACWGNNYDEQLGASTQGVSPQAPVRPALPSGRLLSVSLGAAHSCAVIEGRGVYCWGLDDHGQSSGAMGQRRARPTLIADTRDAVQVAAGASFACARRSDGAVLCWGDNEASQLGRAAREGDVGPRVVEGVSRVRAIFAGYSHACAVRDDQTVACWGLDAWGSLGTASASAGAARAAVTPVVITGVRAVRELAMGYGFTCALSGAASDAARVHCWGHAQFGKTGIEPNFGRNPAPHEITFASEPERIAAGNDHACALLRDGTIVCWGAGEHGELGDGRPIERRTLEPVAGLSGVTRVVAADNATCASSATAMHCWGGESQGRLSIDSHWGAATPARFRAHAHGGVISLGARTACECPSSGPCWCSGAGLLSDATGYIRGTVAAPHLSFARTWGRFRVRSIAATATVHCISREDGRVVCVGSDDDHILAPAAAVAPRVIARAVATGLRGPVELFGAPRHVCALDARGLLRCFGSNTEHQISASDERVLGATTVFDSVRAARGARSRGPLVAMTVGRTCAVVSGAVRCRGGLTTAAAVINVTAGARMSDDVEAIFGGGADSFCARRTNGRYFCWGSNAHGQLGVGPASNTFVVTPTDAPSLDGATQLAIGAQHLCGRWSDGTVRCVGSNSHSQLGDGATSWSASPVVARW